MYSQRHGSTLILCGSEEQVVSQMRACTCACVCIHMRKDTVQGVWMRDRNKPQIYRIFILLWQQRHESRCFWGLMSVSWKAKAPKSASRLPHNEEQAETFTHSNGVEHQCSCSLDNAHSGYQGWKPRSGIWCNVIKLLKNECQCTLSSLWGP